MLPFLSRLLWKSAKNKKVIDEDLERWLSIKAARKIGQVEMRDALGEMMKRFPEYRAVFYYRLARNAEPPPGFMFLSGLLKRLYPPRVNLFLFCPQIGPGLYVHHGFSTIVNAEGVGRNFWVSQQVTVGVSKGGRPTIGHDVRITSGAKVFGAITIGDRSIVGANAVVLKNVPPDCTVAGVPAKIIRREGVRVDEALV